MTSVPQPKELTRTMLVVLCIGILIAASFWIMQPFLTSTVWAAMPVRRAASAQDGSGSQRCAQAKRMGAQRRR